MTLTESQRMTLEFFNFSVPCIFQLSDPECSHPALWLVSITHVVPGECTEDPPAPMCEAHKVLAERAYAHGFWAMWMSGTQLCAKCNADMHIGQLERLPTQ